MKYFIYTGCLSMVFLPQKEHFISPSTFLNSPKTGIRSFTFYISSSELTTIKSAFLASSRHTQKTNQTQKPEILME